ncbi:MAG TPA: phosphohistidine phosphatase SixA [Rhodocyclaceae bacterium]|nr:phosphohistidine phosphatase SixA [Rhodocyclaceae bacterium]
MDLILWRHAEAAEATALNRDPKADLKRRLTHRGEKQARVVARWLLERQPKHLRILVSPAARCQQTAHALGQRFEIEARIAPGADVADLIGAAGWPGGIEQRSHQRAEQRAAAVLLVGHQPALGRLAALLLSGQEADWAVKKGALWWFSSRSREGESQTVLRAVANPDML